MKIYLTRVLKVKRYILWQKYLLENNYKKDQWYFVLAYGIGDTYIISALIDEFSKLNGDVILLFTKENQKFISRLFNPVIKTKLISPPPYHLLNEFGVFKKGIPINLNPNTVLQSKLLNLIGYKEINLVELYKLILGIRFDYKLPLPKLAFLDSKIITDFFKQHGLKRYKTVLLCPNANSISSISFTFWLNIAKILENMNYTVAFLNVKNNTLNYPNVNFELKYSLSICNEANYVISLRSGFCDLISTSTAKKVILYPDIDWHGGKLIDGTSLIKMDLSKSYNTKEIVLDSDEYQIQQKIISYFNG